MNMNPFIKHIVAAKAFHHAIVAVIVLAGVVAGLETSPTLMAKHGALLHALDRLILGVFIVEALLKMAAHGRRPWRYFTDGWNVFDFLIIVICLLPVGGPFAAVLRLARAQRAARGGNARAPASLARSARLEDSGVAGVWLF